MISVNAQNTGDRAGDEVVQLYLRDLVGTVTRPVRELKGFKRIFLEPGEKETVTFKLTQEPLAIYNYKMEYVVEPGVFKVYIGPNSVDCLEDEFEVVVVTH